MKAQVGTLVLSEDGWLPFMVRVHDDRFDEWLREGRDPKHALRNLISLHLKKRLDRGAPDFLFVMEDSTTAGGWTRPHAHGSVGLARSSIPSAGEGSRRLRLMAQSEGQAKAELEAGRLCIKAALKAAAGAHGTRIALTSGIDQARNVWTRNQPYHPLFNHQYIDYAFRNTTRVSKTLGDSRFAMTNPLRGEARRLWCLIRSGEDALEQWA